MKCELINDNFQNYKRYGIPKAQLVIADIPYNLGVNAYASSTDGKEIPNLHPTQKPVKLLKRLIEIFTDEGDVIIDPVAGSGTTLRAAFETNRNSYGFEIVKDFYKRASDTMLNTKHIERDNLLFKEFLS